MMTNINDLRAMGHEYHQRRIEEASEWHMYRPAKANYTQHVAKWLGDCLITWGQRLRGEGRGISSSVSKLQDNVGQSNLL